MNDCLRDSEAVTVYLNDVSVGVPEELLNLKTI